jgi:hypothetical protein
MSHETELSEVKAFRYEMGARILELMEERDDLPLPNVHRLAKVMNEYFKNEGMIDELLEMDYKWRPTIDYWKSHLSDFCEYLRKRDGEKKYFVFVREKGLKGSWKFVGLTEYEKSLKWQVSDIETRTGNYNSKAEDGAKEWPQMDADGLKLSRKLLT